MQTHRSGGSVTSTTQPGANAYGGQQQPASENTLTKSEHSSHMPGMPGTRATTRGAPLGMPSDSGENDRAKKSVEDTDGDGM